MKNYIDSAKEYPIEKFKKDVLAEIHKVLKSKKVCNILITGGRSLSENINFIVENLSVTKTVQINLWLTDERIQIDKSQRNDSEVLDKIKPLNMLFQLFNWEIYSPEKSNFETCLNNMREKLLNNLGDSFFDLSILSIGHDGHIGANWKSQVPYFRDEDFVFHYCIKDPYPNRIGFNINKIKKSRHTFIYLNDKAKIKIMNSMKSSNSPRLYNLSELGNNLRIYSKVNEN